MSENIDLTQGTTVNYTDDKGGADILIKHPVIGVVKNNVDANHNGRIEVYIASIGGPNPDDSKSWISVDYLSPFLGSITPRYDPKNSPDRTGYGSFIGNTHSYGMWFSAPDIGSYVVCIFVGGKRNQGYYIGGVPIVGLHHMIPAIGGSDRVIPNKTEASTYGDATLLPTTEANFSNPTLRASAQPYYEPKPIHSYQTSILAQQGVIRDRVRGVISSSSQRESPSRVFGISTPGGTIYKGGYSNSNIIEAAKTEDSAKLQQVGRTGGHSIVMDDGTINGDDQLMRLRTSGGHQIMMNDSGQTIFIIHSNGNSWIELGKEGTVDIFTENSFNVRTRGDLNLHADRDVNIHGGRNTNIFGNTVRVESDTDTTMRAGGNIQQHCLMNYSLKAEGSLTLDSQATASLSSKTATFIKGKTLFLNTGSGGSALSVKQIPKTEHEDAQYDSDVGWMFPSSSKLFSIVSRATTHQPFIGANKGVQL